MSWRKWLGILVVAVLVPGTLIFGAVVVQDRRAYLSSFLVIVYAMVPFFLHFEKRRPKARELVMIAVLSSLAVVGRMAFFMLPQVKPITAIVIIAGVCFGAETGFLTGAVSALVSNFFFGQGAWTPWQMFCWGLIGFLAGIIFHHSRLRKSRIALCVYGGLSTLLLFGGIMNFSSVLLMNGKLSWPVIVATYAAGIPFDLMHAASTAVFMLLLARPMQEKLERVQVKYGLMDS